jgi:hypothetical protein
MKAAGIAYLLTLLGITLDGRVVAAVTFLSTAVLAAAVRYLMGRGRCRHQEGANHANGFSGG